MPILGGTFAAAPIATELAVTGAASGTIAFWTNNSGYDLLVGPVCWYITTQSTGASTLDIGVGATSATSNDSIIDGLSAATAGTFSNISNAGTNGKGFVKLTSGHSLTVTVASGDASGLVGSVYFYAIPAI